MSNGLFRWRDGRATALHNGLLREFEQPFFGGGGGLAGGSRAGLASFTPGDLVSVRDPASVQAIFAHEGRFYVLGAFDLAGPVRVRNWAVWEPTP
jgi:hypothetical protein